MKTWTLSAAAEYAFNAARELDGLHGDPSLKADWYRERRLAEMVVELVARIHSAGHHLETKS